MQSERDPVATPPAGLFFPETRTEFVNLMAHYYRGEMGRMTSWRDRVDRTSNWAITVTAAMLSVSLTTPTAHHGVLLFAAVLVLLLFAIWSSRAVACSTCTGAGCAGWSAITLPRSSCPHVGLTMSGCGAWPTICKDRLF